MADFADAKWRRRRELGSLLLSCRSRMLRGNANGREGGLRQQDVADLVGISVRYYASFERGETDNPSVHLVESIAYRTAYGPRSALRAACAGIRPRPPHAGPADRLPGNTAAGPPSAAGTGPAAGPHACRDHGRDVDDPGPQTRP